MKNILQFIYCLPLWYVVGLMILVMLIWGILGYLFLDKSIWHWVNRVTSIIMMSIVLIATVVSRKYGTQSVNLIPFYSIIEARVQPEVYRQMLMNVFLFFPIGLTLPFAFSNNCRIKVLKTITIAMIFSVIIEFLQFYFNLGRCEIDDVIMNSLGAVIGTLAYIGSNVLINTKKSIK